MLKVELKPDQISGWAATRFPVTEHTQYLQVESNVETVVLDVNTQKIAIPYDILGEYNHDIVYLKGPAILVDTPFGMLNIIAVYSQLTDVLAYKFIAW